MNELKADKIKVGMDITVLNDKESPSDKSFQGDPLRVKCIDSPFIVVYKVNEGDHYPFPLDTRYYEFKKLSKDYVKALRWLGAVCKRVCERCGLKS